MTLTKNAIGNLINKYRAVLTKCRFLNTLCSLAVAGVLMFGAVSVAMADSGINWVDADNRAGVHSSSGDVTGGNVLIDNGGSTLDI